MRAGMAAESPLAGVMAGLELLLARSQLWQESAARHVSIERQLEHLAALALRWRRMQLHAWRHTIHKLKARHAAGMSSPPLCCPAEDCTQKKCIVHQEQDFSMGCRHVSFRIFCVRCQFFLHAVHAGEK